MSTIKDKKNKEGFSDRLRQAVIILTKGNVSKFAQLVNIPKQSMHQYLSGGSPTLERIRQISEEADIDVTWLVTGRGGMKKNALWTPGEALETAVKILEEHLNKEKITMNPESKSRAVKMLYHDLIEGRTTERFMEMVDLMALNQKNNQRRNNER